MPAGGACGESNGERSVFGKSHLQVQLLRQSDHGHIQPVPFFGNLSRVPRQCADPPSQAPRERRCGPFPEGIPMKESGEWPAAHYAQPGAKVGGDVSPALPTAGLPPPDIRPKSVLINIPIFQAPPSPSALPPVAPPPPAPSAPPPETRQHTSSFEQASSALAQNSEPAAAVAPPSPPEKRAEPKPEAPAPVVAQTPPTTEIPPVPAPAPANAEPPRPDTPPKAPLTSITESGLERVRLNQALAAAAGITNENVNEPARESNPAAPPPSEAAPPAVSESRVIAARASAASTPRPSSGTRLESSLFERAAPIPEQPIAPPGPPPPKERGTERIAARPSAVSSRKLSAFIPIPKFARQGAGEPNSLRTEAELNPRDRTTESTKMSIQIDPEQPSNPPVAPGNGPAPETVKAPETVQAPAPAIAAKAENESALSGSSAAQVPPAAAAKSEAHPPLITPPPPPESTVPEPPPTQLVQNVTPAAAIVSPATAAESPPLPTTDRPPRTKVIEKAAPWYVDSSHVAPMQSEETPRESAGAPQAIVPPPVSTVESSSNPVCHTAARSKCAPTPPARRP